MSIQKVVHAACSQVLSSQEAFQLSTCKHPSSIPHTGEILFHPSPLGSNHVFLDLAELRIQRSLPSWSGYMTRDNGHHVLDHERRRSVYDFFPLL